MTIDEAKKIVPLTCQPSGPRSTWRAQIRERAAQIEAMGFNPNDRSLHRQARDVLAEAGLSHIIPTLSQGGTHENHL